jgi:phosphopantothenoylcysteine decarboxylase/phosphopantothenate--cysteine ligase
MGLAVAEAAIRAGCEVTIVLGPVPVAAGAAPREPRRPRFRILPVESAREMAAAAIPAFRNCDIAFHVAAVADFRPASRVRGKIKKRAALAAGKGRFLLELVPNPDILWSCGKIKRKGQILVGFALESVDGERNARSKLREKNLDFVVWNGPSTLNADRANVTVITREGKRTPIRGTKAAIGRRLVALALARWHQSQHATQPTQRKHSKRRRARLS